MPKEPAKPDYQPPSTRDQQINIRIEPDLYDEAMKKSAGYGLGPIIRALLRAFIRGDIALPVEDLQRELTSAPRGRPPRHKSRKRPDMPKT
jgi:hypothetical protein